MPEGVLARIQSLLGQMPTRGLAAVQELFWTELGYCKANKTLSSDQWPEWARRALVDNPTLFARHKARDGRFAVIHTRLRAKDLGVHRFLSHGAERCVTEQLLLAHPQALYVYSDPEGKRWSLVNVPSRQGAGRRRLHRRISIESEDHLESAARRVALFRLPGAATNWGCDQVGLTAMQVQDRHDQAFDVEAAADAFSQRIKHVFEDLRMDLALQGGDMVWAHGYALRFLSQLLFVCFLQRTRWLGNDPHFLSNLWRDYGRSGRRANSFVSEWLEGALFAALCGSAQPGYAGSHRLPAAARGALETAPRFEGGLFLPSGSAPHQGAVSHPTIQDSRFEQLLGFLEGCDFTPHEDTLVAQQVAVGPAILGQIYESLVSVTTEEDERGKKGVYYTPRVEIDLMCRLALVDWLTNHLGSGSHPLINRALFAAEVHSIQEADSALARGGLWPRVNDLLSGLTVMDPACGSGSFLIGMCQVLDDLLARARLQLGIEETSFERKKRIIAGSLYGVEADRLPAEIARSRLWLHLLADPNSRRAGTEALRSIGGLPLPDLLHRVCCDDSLLPRGGSSAVSEETVSGMLACHERRHFDIVMGNPPYVRQELIQGPDLRAGRAELEAGSRYKARVARAIYEAWPNWFGYDQAKARSRRRLDARSDLYVYFFLHGLSLLHAQGTLCFVSSSSWLDARYGRDLQEFLLSRGRVKLVIDNLAHRSFVGAGINTAIVLLGAAHDTEVERVEAVNEITRFVVLAIPFEQAFNPAIWERVAGTNTRCASPEYRVLALEQGRLIRSGTDSHLQRFVGEKWGAKYLRAPDIYWVVKERYADTMVRLGDRARIRRGTTTGANEFFFMDERNLDHWGIESEFLLPAVKSARQLGRVWLNVRQGVGLRLFVCPRNRAELRGTAALDYIEYGERMGFHKRATCRRRRRWWDLGSPAGARIHCSYMADQVMRFCGGDTPFLSGDGFQAIDTEFQPEVMMAACNSTLCQLSANVVGRSNFGGGLLKLQTYELRDLVIPDPRCLPDEVGVVIRNAGLLALDDPDRRVLDEMIFDAVGLTPGERDAVLEAVSSMVTARIAKARSLASR